MSIVPKETNTPTRFFQDGSPSRVWRMQIAGTAGDRSVSLPATGVFDIIFIEVPKVAAMSNQMAETAETPNVPRVSDFIGYGRRFHPEYRSTEDVMRELREGEEA